MSGKTKRATKRVRALRKPVEFEQFTRRYAAGETAHSLSKELKIGKNTATAWAGTVRLTLGEHFRRRCTDAELVDRWEKQYRATRGNSRTRVLELITKITDGFPAPKEPLPVQSPITVIIDMDCAPGKPELEEAPAQTKIVEVERTRTIERL